MPKKFEIFAQPNAVLNDKVQAIKSLRYISGLGLKEAKDVVDAAGNGQRVTFSEQEARYRKSDTFETYNLDREIQSIRACGYSVVEMNDRMSAQVKNLIIEAIECDEYTMAIDLIAVLQRRT